MLSHMICDVLKSAIKKLQLNSDSSRLDAELLLSHCLEKDRSYLLTWPEHVIDEQTFARFQHLLQQREQGVPIAYLLGYREFWTLCLRVTEDTLIPRPETELLVEIALEEIPENQAVSVLDLGTGTGAIALSIASERPLSKLLAVDVSAKALAVAKQNAQDHQLRNISFLHSNWFDDIPVQSFDFILSNPPYIEDSDEHLAQGDVRYEPQLALTSGADGFDDIRQIIQQCHPYLKAKGWLMFEHGYQQGEKSRELLRTASFEKVRTLQDLAGNERVTLGQCGVVRRICSRLFCSRTAS